MIIQCRRLISATTKEELEFSPWMTQDKKYLVLTLAISLNEGIFAVIQSDHRNQVIFKQLDGFEIISQKIPRSWGMRTEDNFYCYLMPKSWMYSSDFFGELDDENPKAVELFKKEAEIMYREEGWL